MSGTEIAELPEQHVDGSPPTDLWGTCIKAHADRNWPRHWTWSHIMQRVERISATPSPDQLWDMHVAGQALGHVQYRPTQCQAMHDYQLRRIQYALKFWGTVLIRDAQFKSQRAAVVQAVRRHLARLGHRS